MLVKICDVTPFTLLNYTFRLFDVTQVKHTFHDKNIADELTDDADGVQGSQRADDNHDHMGVEQGGQPPLASEKKGRNSG